MSLSAFCVWSSMPSDAPPEEITTSLLDRASAYLAANLDLLSLTIPMSDKFK